MPKGFLESSVGTYFIQVVCVFSKIFLFSPSHEGRTSVPPYSHHVSRIVHQGCNCIALHSSFCDGNGSQTRNLAILSSKMAVTLGQDTPVVAIPASRHARWLVVTQLFSVKLNWPDHQANNFLLTQSLTQASELASLSQWNNDLF